MLLRSIRDRTAPASGWEQTPHLGLAPPPQFSPQSSRGLPWPMKYSRRIPRPAARQQTAAAGSPCCPVPASACKKAAFLPCLQQPGIALGPGERVSNGAVSGKVLSHSIG